MMEMFLFGIGAAGNKAAIEVLQRRIMPEGRVRLLNTTLKDIPDAYKEGKSDLAIKFSAMLGGCGKEPNKGCDAMYKAIVNEEIDLASMIDPSTKAVILVTSIEGGTGCGATPIVAKYFTALNMPVHVFALIGFGEDTRGLNNSLKFFRELPDGVILHTIENQKFLDYTKNYAVAEQKANEEFASQVEILIGSKMVPSSQNIDDTDHYKVVTTPGYMDIRHVDISGAKNYDLTNKATMESFEEMKGFEYDNAGCKRIAVIVNANPKTQSVVDNELTVVKRYTGEPLEVYRHVQNDDSEDNEYIDIIIAGLPFPEEGILNIGKKYASLKEKLNKDSKKLADIFGNIDLDDELEESSVRQMRNPNDVVADFKKQFPKSRAIKINNVKRGSDSIIGQY